MVDLLALGRYCFSTSEMILEDMDKTPKKNKHNKTWTA